MKYPIRRIELPTPDPLGATHALEIYSGCGCGCTYCDTARHLRSALTPASPAVLREGIVAAVFRQLSDIRNCEIFDGVEHRINVTLCRGWDPYPPDTDTEPTREIIRLIKAFGHAVTIVTKRPEPRDFDLLDQRDTYCVSLSTSGGEEEPGALPPADRLCLAIDAQEASGCRTAAQIVVLDAADALRLAELPMDKIVFMEPRRRATRGVILRDKLVARAGGRACFA